MGGRHRAGADPGSRRGPFEQRRIGRRRARLRRLVATAVVIGVVVAGGAVGANQYFGCTETAELRVAATPEIAPVVEEVAASLAADKGLTFRGPCLDVGVTARQADEVSRAVAAGDLAAVDSPDVWIADSSLWTGQARASEAGAAALGEDQSIVESPVVLAMIRPAAEQLGWPDQQPTWERVLETIGSGTVNVGLADPTKSAVSMLTLTGVGILVGGRPDGQVLLVQTIRALTSRLSATTDDVVSKLPQTPEQIQQTSLGLVGAFPYSEQGVFSYNRDNPGVPLAAVYPAEGSPLLDYPYVRMASATPMEALDAGADRLLEALQSPDGQRLLHEHGFRSAGGTAGIDMVAAHGVLPGTPTSLPAPEAATLEAMRGLWTAANLSARILTVLDVSGSMAEEVPDSGGKTRMDLAKEAILTALPQLREDTSVGLWIFSTLLDGDRDYQEVVPVRPLGAVVEDASQRNTLNAAASQIAPSTGNTGLYDTILAAFQTMVAAFQPGSINVVVVMTDGQNDDRPGGGISREELVAALGEAYNPEQPVAIITVSFGPDIDEAELGPVAEATGGAAHVTSDARQITQVLLQAIVDQAASTG